MANKSSVGIEAPCPAGERLTVVIRSARSLKRCTTENLRRFAASRFLAALQKHLQGKRGRTPFVCRLEEVSETASHDVQHSRCFRPVERLYRHSSVPQSAISRVLRVIIATERNSTQYVTSLDSLRFSHLPPSKSLGETRPEPRLIQHINQRSIALSPGRFCLTGFENTVKAQSFPLSGGDGGRCPLGYECTPGSYKGAL